MTEREREGTSRALIVEHGLSICKVRTGTSRVQLFNSFATLTLEINMLGSNVLTVDEADNTIIARSKIRKLNPLSIYLKCV